MSAAARPAPWGGLAAPAPVRLARPWLPFAAVAGAAVVVTLAVAVVGPLRMTYPAPSLHVALETGTGLIGLVATAIVVRGWRDGPRLDRLVIAAGLAVIALTSAALAAMLAISPGAGPRGLVALTGMLVGSLLVAAGAFTPVRRPAAPAAAVAAMVVVVLAALAAAVGPVELVLDAWRGHAPPDGDPTRTLLGQPLPAIALQLLMALSLAVAAVGITGRGIRMQDGFAGLLGLAILCFAFSMLQYALLPPLGHEWVHMGDLLRLVFCVVLLWAAVAEVARAVASRAAARERRRIARDLHDGVVQELAGTAFSVSALVRDADTSESSRPTLRSASVALRDSLKSLRSLLAEIHPPELHAEGLAAALDDLIAPAAAAGIQASVSIEGEESASDAEAALVWRVAQEAVRNAIRHSGATTLAVTVRGDGARLTLGVVDDGVGFDTDNAVDPDRYGLRGLRSLVRDVGGELEVISAPGEGTTVRMEVDIP